MRSTAILTIIIWLTALTGIVAFAYLSTQPAWNTLAERVMQAPIAIAEPVAEATTAATISAFDRERLTQGLASLQISLETYQEQLLHSGN